ncbi:DUF2520 domain-containing protein [Conexibacter arvalis]|uniref:Putative short-subunit dehydrogenase-like oxidoreductase (DUF2520 family) n=1 Tax=Conexibacter arvalis TaxID=912552 RepID=A0A840IJ95_9ACTN|nr:DUF2520 domain-containing protein [Conexibacter arvalis]MBB4664010.1 putative short-subunit dehydrogenase-like oxidoreductase (DUF2520 family) [Conexibacter arvalis]
MWELERESDLPDLTRLRCAIVGAGRLGRALAPALRDAGIAVEGPLGRGADGGEADIVLLCVPDGEIAAAAAAIAPRPGRLVGHCSGALTLEPLGDHEGFSLHPLMSVPLDGASRLAGAAAAVAGATDRARAVATALAFRVGLTPVAVADEDRAAYHAAASIASNFLVTLQAAAEQMAASAGIERAALVPLVRAALENWAAIGPERALTGPLVRGDEETVARQRAAVAERAPELLELFDALADATRELARGTRAAIGAGTTEEDR